VLAVWALVVALSPASAGAVHQAADGDGEGIDYVALGDSYSAGPLIPEPRQDPAGCLRSTNNYPAYLAGHLGVATYTDVTCSGARTRDLRRSQTLFLGGVVAPQRDALSVDTDLVTLGIGGNDFSLFGSMTGTCTRLRDRDPDGAPCRRAFRVRVGDRVVDSKARDARRIADRVARAVDVVRERAPEATILVVGYPRLLPPEGTCPDVPFATGDYAWARRIEVILHRSLRRAAERSGADFVGTRAASSGHDACAGEEAWVNGHVVRVGVAAPFHPLQAGMRGVAAAVFEAHTGLTAPDVAQAPPPPTSGQD
jgi:lysophospholipase L1-like esterase